MSSPGSTPPYPGALPPPNGVTPVLDEGTSALKVTIIVAVVIELVAPTICLVLRLYIRGRLVKLLNLADVSIVIAYCCFCAGLGFVLSLIPFGAGIPGWNVAPARFTEFARSGNYEEWLYMPAICFTKIAILIQFMEIFTLNTRDTRWRILLGLIVVNCLFFTTFMFIDIFTCTPRERIWDPSVPGTCIDIQKTFIATSLINVIDDFAILILPIFWAAKLRISGNRKLKVCLIYAFGLFACVCSVMRLAESIISVSDHDITISLIPVSLWAYAEISAGILVACIPYIPRLFKSQTDTSTAASSRHSFKDPPRRTFGDSEDCFVSMHEIESNSGDSETLHSRSESRAIEIEQVPGGIMRTIEIEQTVSERRLGS